MVCMVLAVFVASWMPLQVIVLYSQFGHSSHDSGEVITYSSKFSISYTNSFILRISQNFSISYDCYKVCIE